MHVGELIRKFRKEKKMTLLELSEKSGVALATLSRMENGKMTGRLESHIKICAALEITLPELYKDLPTSKKIIELHTKTGNADVFIHNKKSSSEILISSAASKKMTPVMVTISENSSTNNEEAKPGIERFVYVLDGKIEAYIGEEKYNLTKGDTLYFAASIPHHFKNTGGGAAHLITVTSPSA